MAKDTPAATRGGPSPSDCAKMSLSCACLNLRRASRVVTQVFDGYFDEVGLKATQFTVLAALAWYDKNPPAIGTLAEVLVLEQSSLSRNLAVLERLGYIRLTAGEADRRERIVSLTRGGRGALARGYPVWKKAQAALGSLLEAGELDSHVRSLRRLTTTGQALRPRRPRGRGGAARGRGDDGLDGAPGAAR
ncbi:MAG: winged helix-turn-helix transcriptional regulator [Labilithrix sp.]|nr:winged helix-turn-helix transcriptional regulator [Labilithrix sp.]MBX3210490.1 winged helix-turn-helix transcriptional regulator [Labilithrix sp.]